MVGWVKGLFGIVDVLYPSLLHPLLAVRPFRWAENVKNILRTGSAPGRKDSSRATVVQEALSPEAVSTARLDSWLIGVGLLVMVIGLVLRIVLNKRKKTRSTVVEVRSRSFPEKKC